MKVFISRVHLHFTVLFFAEYILCGDDRYQVNPLTRYLFVHEQNTNSDSLLLRRLALS